ncbi:TonB-dependent receptor [Mucilaginibacter sp. CSA2-8R]|uniref:SusC/RagA family TonB-linked outer membrane protein n=1 Tax=Mucilaginibacter sp. CSA2-8R TaxID=3141542 RepID=UPI00315D0F70
MKKILLILLALSIGVSNYTYAQSRKITGTVTSADDGSPLPGVSVKVNGTNGGTQTNAQGDFSITVPNNASLTFTYIGYTTKTAEVGTANTLNVKLSSDSKALTEVVVTGYGQIQQKREIGGAISTVSGKDFANQPIASVQSALQGRAAGVVVTANSGIPGGAINVRIRGVGSFTGSTQPLYIVDGVQLSGDTFTGFTQGNTLAGINTNDIESIDIIKDAASTSLYGSQGANGVVIITTKKGKAGKTKIGFNYYQGRSSSIKKYDVLNTQDFYNVRRESYLNAGSTAAAARTSALAEINLPASATDADIAAAQSTNWQDAAFHTGRVSNYDFNMNGGNEKTTFFVSAAYSTISAIVTKADFQRGTFKVNLDHKANDKLSFNTSLNLSTFNQKAPFAVNGSFLGSPAFAASTILPSNPIYNADGSYFGLPGSGQSFTGVLNQNIVAVNDYNQGNQRTNQLIGSFSANYNILPSLQFKSFYSLDYRMALGKNYRDPRTNDGYAIRGSSESFSDIRTNIITDQTLNFNKTINSDHKISALLGFEYRKQISTQIDEYGTGFPTNQFRNLSAAANPVSVFDSFSGFKSLSYFGKASYSYKGKYSLSGTARYQGSSKFGTNNQFGWFGGVAGAWSISEESFLKEVSWVNSLKLRASVGSAGNDQPLGNFDNRSLFGGGYLYNGSPGIAPTTLANIDLKWERGTTYDVGLDFSLFKDRVSGSFGYYVRNSTNLLLAQPVSSTSGFTSITTNVGSIRNSGPEIELTTINIASSGFRWTTNFNFTYTKNEITKLYGGFSSLPSDPSVAVGQPRGAVYTYQSAGINPATGRAFWYDANNNVVYSPALSDRRFVGNSLIPKFTGGFNNTFSFKGFDLSALFTYQYGQIATDAQYNFILEGSRRLINTTYEVYDRRWTTPGQITDVPRPNTATEPNSISANNGTRLYYKTDYIRMREGQFGYTFPSKVLSKIKVNNLRIYAQATNLITITKFPGYDPEYYDTTNNNAGAIPTSKNFTVGVQLGL